METTTWVMSVIGVFSGAMLTLITTLIVNQVSYKNEYYKMIIEKRVKAYNCIEKLINDLFEKYNKLPKEIDNSNVSLLIPLIDEINSANNESIWLSKKIKTALNFWRDDLLLVILKHTDENICKMAGDVNVHRVMNNGKKMVEKQIIEDLLTMYKVKWFLKNKYE